MRRTPSCSSGESARWTSASSRAADDGSRPLARRHGESTWNKENRFTGWCDVPLSEKGEHLNYGTSPLRLAVYMMLLTGSQVKDTPCRLGACVMTAWSMMMPTCGCMASGTKEAQDGGRLLKEAGYKFDKAYTSVLRRAIKTCLIVLEEVGRGGSSSSSWGGTGSYGRQLSPASCAYARVPPWPWLSQMDLLWIPVTKAWELNERHYGALQVLTT